MNALTDLRRYLAHVPRLEFPPIPSLTTPRLLLRAPTMEDAPAVFRMRSDPRVMHHIPKPLFFKAKEAESMLRDFQRAFATREAVIWGIALKEAEELCGIIGYWRIIREHRRAEIGYFLDPALWGRGLMTEALATALDFGFSKMELHSVEASTHPANAASIHVLENNGFVREGYFRENIRNHGEFQDSVVYSRFAPD